MEPNHDGIDDSDVLVQPDVELDLPQPHRSRTEGGGTHVNVQRNLAVGGIVALVVVAVVVGAVILLAAPAEPKLQVPTHFSGEFTTTSRYDRVPQIYGKVTKRTASNGRSIVEGVAEYEQDKDLRVIVTYVNKRAYRTVYNQTVSTTVPESVSCVPSSYVPPFGDVGELLNSASPVPTSSLDPNNPALHACIQSGNAWAARWGVMDVLYCQPDNDAHVVATDTYSSVFVVDSVYKESLGLTAPVDPATGIPPVCPEIQDKTSLGVEGPLHDHITGAAPTRRLGMMMDIAAPARPCVFVHGMGQDKDESSVDHWSYWGALDEVLADQCSSIEMLRLDSRDKAWSDPSHANNFCDAAAGGHNGNIIGSKLIFSHGSGSLVVAAALSQLTCQMGGAKWYTAASPFSGSHAADSGLDVCANYNALKSVLDKLRMCKGANKDQLHTGIKAEKTTYSSSTFTFAGMTTVARNNVAGAMCGHSSEGNFESYGQGMTGIDAEIYFGGENDGWIRLDHCTTQKQTTWSKHYTANYADMHLNYLDMSCRWADPVMDTGGDHSPCKWYLEMARKL